MPDLDVAVDSRHLVQLLEASGWRRIESSRQHVWLGWPGGSRRPLVVPLDPTAPEYARLFAEAVAELSRAVQAGERAAAVLAEFRGDDHG